MDADAEVARLLVLLDQAYDRKSWHGTNLRGSLRTVSALQAAWRPAPQRHNIWEIVVHAAYWKYAVWRRFTGERRGSFPLTGSNWFRRPMPDLHAADGAADNRRDTSSELERAWRADIALLRDRHAALRAAMAKLKPGDLDRFARGGTITNFDLLAGVAAHDLYHAGQIQVLKKLAP